MTSTSVLDTIAADIPREVAFNSDLQSLAYDGATLVITIARELLSETTVSGILISKEVQPRGLLASGMAWPDMPPAPGARGWSEGRSVG